jgi:hypothetical protein
VKPLKKIDPALAGPPPKRFWTKERDKKYWSVWLSAFRRAGYSSIAGYLAAGEWLNKQRSIDLKKRAQKKARKPLRRQR